MLETPAHCQVWISLMAVLIIPLNIFFLAKTKLYHLLGRQQEVLVLIKEVLGSSVHLCLVWPVRKPRNKTTLPKVSMFQRG